jgi:hypothetical protein
MNALESQQGRDKREEDKKKKPTNPYAESWG